MRYVWKSLLVLTLTTAVTPCGCRPSTVPETTKSPKSSDSSRVERRKTDWQEAGLIGAVKSVRTENAEYADRYGTWVEGRRETFEEVSYNLSGNKVEHDLYANGLLAWKYLYTYNANRNEIEVTGYTADGSLDEKIVHLYDTGGHRIRMTRYDADGKLRDKRISVFDTEGNEIQATEYDADGGVGANGKDVYKYDAKGHRIRCDQYDADGKSVGKKIYTYDGKGNNLKVVLYDAKGHLQDQQAYSYDSRGNQDEYCWTNADGSLVLKESYSYEYDTTGNWTKKVTSEWVTKFGESFFEPNKATFRRIVYYKREAKPGGL
ncbi:MAG TPA: hypothetical protein VFI02_15460 [Armatimonadota bacterium]|nr:hypothetical protein [Armatimonadota bacterium]